MSSQAAYRQTGMAYASVNGLQLYHEIRGSGRPLVHVGVSRRPSEVLALITPFLDAR